MKADRVCFLVFLWVITLIIIFGPTAKAEDFDCWILCQPDSFVYARTSPKKTSMELGRLECGDHVYTDGIIRHGFLHVYGLTFEMSEGWVHKGYVVYDEPYKPAVYETQIVSNGRVNARRTINGKRRCWLKDGESIKVYMVSDEWATTNKGFVKTKYIDLGR